MDLNDLRKMQVGGFYLDIPVIRSARFGSVSTEMDRITAWSLAD